MTNADWAYAPSERAPAPTVLDLLAAALRADERSDLLAAWGAFAAGLDDATVVGATADNVTHSVGGLAMHRRLRPGMATAPRATIHARLCWHLAHSLLMRGATGHAGPDASVDELALDYAGRAGLPITRGDLNGFIAFEAITRSELDGGDVAEYAAALRAAGLLTARRAAATDRMTPPALRAALLAAYEQLDGARRDRDRAETAAIELVATRELARSLGEQLERDEWIRARLRRAKATAPARALIAARKRLLRREPQA